MPDLNRTRISQKIINSKGAITGTKSQGEPRMAAGITLCCPRKNEPDAMVSAALMRQRRCNTIPEIVCTMVVAAAMGRT